MRVDVGDFLSPNGLTGNQDIALPAGCPDLTAAAAGSWAILFWYTTSQATPTTDTWNPNISAGIGFVANGGGSLSQFAIGSNSDDAVSPSNSNRIVSAGVIAQPTGAAGTQDLAAFVSFPDATHIRLNWTTKIAGPRRVLFTVLSGLTGAKVLNTVLGGSTGFMPVTGAGFSPDLVIHATSNVASGGTAATHGLLGLGVLNRHGQQWAASIWSSDAVTPSITSRFQQTDACLAVVRSDAVTERIEFEAQGTSMDSDGYTMYAATNNIAATWQLISLCIDGVSSKIGAFTTAASGTQDVDTRHGFTPKGLMLATIGQGETTPPVANAVLSIGATDLTNHRAVALADQDAQATTAVKSLWSNTVDAVVAASAGTTTQTITESAVSTTQVSFALSTAAGGYEVLYLLLGDIGVSTFPVKVDTDSVAAATGYSNQKKLAVLSTGRRVACIADATGYFYWSDDGYTWVAFGAGAQILGAVDISIAAYVDAGGTERLVAVWKQSGTSGGRTSNLCYVAVGTFDPTLASLTWGTARALGGATLFDYPDVVAHAEGTGGMAHVTVSYAEALPTNAADYYPVTVDSLGVPTVGTQVELSPPYPTGYGVFVHTYPSIDMDPVNKHLFVGWSAGKTGAGFGIRFRKATYLSGTWTWGAEREIDNTFYVSSTSRWVNVRYDAERAVAMIGGMAHVTVPPGDSHFLYERDAADSTTTLRFAATAVHPFNGGMAIDPTTGDVYLVGDNAAALDIGYAKWDRASNTLGSLVTTEYDHSLGTTFASVLTADDAIAWLYMSGNSALYLVRYDEVELAAAAASPTARLKRWNGLTWVDVPMKVWDGAEWVVVD